jgi:hypothetical protein
MPVVAGLITSAIPGYAQDQPNIPKLKADAENLVKMTLGNKQKTQTYCDLLISVIKSAKRKTPRKPTSYPRRRTSLRES